MTERSIIIHWGPTSEADIGEYTGEWLAFVNKINDVFNKSENPIVVDGSFSKEYKPEFDTVALRRISPEMAVNFVNPGDTVTLYGCRRTVCVEMARRALVEILGSSNVKVSEDGTID